MIAIVKIGGHQALVQVGDILEVDKLNVEAGKKVNFETLLVSEADGSSFQVGTPFLEGITVEAKVLSSGRGEKIRIFKMKPRKRYRRTQGHRQDYTEIEITAIGGAAKKAAPKKAVAKKTEEKAEKKPVAKKPAAKKAPAKKAAAKKAE